MFPPLLYCVKKAFLYRENTADVFQNVVLIGLNKSDNITTSTITAATITRIDVTASSFRSFPADFLQFFVT